MAEWPPTEQEERLEGLFMKVEKLFKKAAKTKDPEKIHAVMKDISDTLKEGKSLTKDFEREARADGMPVPMMQERKKAIADRLNEYIKQRKEMGSAATKDELFSGAVQAQEDNMDQMTNQQLMVKGKKTWEDTENILARAERVVEDTEQVGVQTAAALNDQTKQLNNIVDDLTDMEFNVKKATKIITDITRGMLTDKCIGFLLFAAIAGVIVIIVLKVVNPNKKKISDAVNSALNQTNLDNLITDTVSNGINTATGAVSSATGVGGRRMLSQAAHDFLQSLLSDDDF